jgi:hypothetical protein
MVSLRNGSAELFRRKPKLANTQEFPRGNSAAMNYSIHEKAESPVSLKFTKTIKI